MKVAVITRSLRAEACMAYMALFPDDSRYIILTADTGAFAREEGRANSEVRRVATGPLRVDRVGMAMAARRRLLGWTRSGSWLGQFVESTAKKILAIRKPVASPVRESDEKPPRHDHLYHQLVEINQEEPIEQVYVFDLFDLPATLAFSDDFGVKVVVR